MNIKGFKLHHLDKEDLHNGLLFEKVIDIPFAHIKERKRYLRVWIPEDFSFEKEYGVIYMSDGQNAVANSLAPFGEWNMEDHLINLTNEGYPEFIVVGIDCPYNPNERFKEYTPYKPSRYGWHKNEKVYGDKFSKFLIDVIHPIILQKFKINRDLIGFCGSSMGGLISFYIYAKYPSVIKFALSYSPAFHAYTSSSIIDSFTKWNPNANSYGSLSIYTGGGDSLERTLLPEIKLINDLLLKQGFSEKLQFIYDKNKPHNEQSWSDNVITSLKFILNNIKKV